MEPIAFAHRDDVEWSDSLHHNDFTMSVKAEYKTQGRCFVSKQRGPERDYWEMRAILLCDIWEQVDEFNRLTQPIDNGPEDRVAFCEAITRLAFCAEEVRSRSKGRPFDNLLAALAGVGFIPSTTT